MKAIFVGLTTLDIVYSVDHPPGIDEKIVAADQLLAAGGPATNAAITFAFLGGESVLYSAIGRHPINDIARRDILAGGVEIRDMMPDGETPLSFSSVMVKADTGERSVVSMNAQKVQVGFNADRESFAADLLLVDGHQMPASRAACEWAASAGVPRVLDGGSWKTGTERLLPLIDYAICSERFHPPGCRTPDEVFRHLAAAGVRQAAITRGGKPLLCTDDGHIEALPVPAIQAVDTLGAGDIFHGAFCYFLLRSLDFVEALQKASEVAAFSCRFFGTRAWMQHWPPAE